MDKQGLLAEDDLPVRKVDTPEWKSNPVVYVRMLTGPERMALGEFSEAGNGDKAEDEALALQFLWRFAAFVLCDESGHRMFSDEERQLLKHKNPFVLDRIITEAQDHNGMTKKSHEEAVKNSEATTLDEDT
jgi:hypothetical protein